MASNDKECYLPEDQIIMGKHVLPCEAQVEEMIVDSFCMVIFGGAGDLSKRKLMPTIFHLYNEGKLPEHFSIVGFSHTDYNTDTFREMIDEYLKKYTSDIYNKELASKFIQRIHYIKSGFETDTGYKSLFDFLCKDREKSGDGKCNTLYYMSVPPRFFPVIIKKLEQFSLSSNDYNPRIIIEKPFGEDLQSARELNDIVSATFSENQIYRIDHYLGKETVQNIIFFRFSNSIFEPLWNRRYIDNVQITVAEDIGIENRGNFYEKASVVRDIIQNHMLQLIALVAMEPPVGFEADYIRNEKVKVYNSIRIMDNTAIKRDTVKGQYGPGLVNGENVIGYRSENRVDPESNTPSFFAGKFYIDNWRWAGVPFYVRAGKRLKKRLTEIVIQFKQPPLKLFGRTCDVFEPSFLILRIQPKESITLRYTVKYPNTPNKTHHVNMKFSYEDEFNIKSYPAYSRLILDCMKGDLSLFVRQDGIEAMWSVIDPITRYWESHRMVEFPNYIAGTWGPRDSDLLLERDGRRWINTFDDKK